MGGAFVQQQDRHDAGHVCDELGVGQHEARQQRLLLAGGTERRFHILRPVAHGEVGAVWAFQRASCRPVPWTGLGKKSAVGIFQIRRHACRAGCKRLFQGAFQCDRRLGKRRIRGLLHDARQQTGQLAAGKRDSRASLRHLVLDRREIRHIPRSLFQQPVAGPHGAFEIVDAAAMTGVDRQHHSVQKSPTVGGRTGEEAVHGRGQPEDAGMVEECFGGLAGAVDADLSLAFRAGRSRLQTRTDPGLAQRTFKTGMHGPACRFGAGLRHRLVGRTAQAATGRQEGHRFQQVRLAGPVRPRENHMATVQGKIEGGVVAERVEPHGTQRYDRGRTAGGFGASLLCRGGHCTVLHAPRARDYRKGVSRGETYTRIGMST